MPAIKRKAPHSTAASSASHKKQKSTTKPKSASSAPSKSAASTTTTTSTTSSSSSPSSSRQPNGKRPWSKKPQHKPAVFSRADRAVLRKERRASKPHHDIIANANTLWRFDFKRLDAAARSEKIQQILDSSSGAMQQLLLKHDTSRVFQLMAKHGTAAQRERLHAQCVGHYLSLCQDHYAHHFVLKLLQYGTALMRRQVWSELYAHLSAVAMHGDAAVVLDFLFAMERDRKMQNEIIRELLHPQFLLDAQTTPFPFALSQTEEGKTGGGGGGAAGIGREVGATLSSLCASHPDLSSGIISNVRTLLDRWLHKSQLQFRFVQSIIRQLFDAPPAVLPASARADLIASLTSSPSLSSLTSSDDGVLALCSCVTFGTAKDRKQVMRGIKGEVPALCRSSHGHVLLTRIVQLVDDTVAVEKNVWSPVLTDAFTLSQLLLSVQGAKALQALLDSGKGKEATAASSAVEAVSSRAEVRQQS